MSELYELQPRVRAPPSANSSDSSPGALTPDEDDESYELRDDMPSDLRPGETLSPDEEELNRRTVRKLDVILLPFLALLFLFNSLDKSNIGSAESAHFTTDAGLDREDVNTAVALFFVFFVALQPVGAALGRKYGMKRWVPACMAIWGLCTTLHVWVHAAWQLYVLRITIATLEAGFYPITVSYLSLFYTRFEFGRRLAVFYGQAAVAGAFGGILSYAVFSRFPGQDGHKIEDPTTPPDRSGWHSWQILFLIEGCTTMTIALTGFFWLPERAKTAWFLNPDEREWGEERIKRDREGEVENYRPKRSPSPFRAHEEHEDLEASHQSTYSTSEEAQGLLSVSPHGRGYPPPQENPSMNTTDHGLSAHDVLSALSSWKRAIALGLNGWGNVAGVLASLLFSPRFAAGGYRQSFVWTALAVLLAAAGFAGFRALIAAENERRRRVLAGWTDDEVEAERRWGRGPLRVDGGGRGQLVLDRAVEWLEGKRSAGGGGGMVAGKVAGWIGEWRGREREGDERVTFVYGL
ncbi:Major facilitator superfamily [Lasiodiplodia theobromae]|nr:Major facilitator superfamily [Lasiodiplodia theobromae]